MVNYIFSSAETGARAPACEEMLKFAREQLAGRSPMEIAQAAGVIFDEDESAFKLESLGQSITISYPSWEAVLDNGMPPYWAWHLIMLHYLYMADGAPTDAEAITFGMLEGGFIRGAGFDREAARSIGNRFGRKPLQNVEKAFQALGGKLRPSNADICAEFLFLPYYPITIRLWLADDELDGSGQMLVGGHASRYLSVEDAVTAGEILLKFLIKQYDIVGQL